MRCAIAAAGAVACLWAGYAAERRFDFANDEIGKPPAGFRSALVGNGKPGEWKVILDDAAPAGAPLAGEPTFGGKRRVLAQLSRDPTDERFPLLIFDEETFGDFTLTAKVKLVGGAIEQMAGLAFRIKDEKNYYAARVSALGHNFRFYRVAEGVRDQPLGPEVEIAARRWHDLEVQCRGNRIRLFLNGKQVLPEITDNTFVSGKIGLWTKSDSVSYFTDLRLTFTPREYLAKVLVRDALKRYPRLLGLKIFAVTPGTETLRIVASDQEQDLNQPGGPVERDTIAKDAMFYGKSDGKVLVTLPLHDRNGEPIAAVRVVMKPFPGQTQQNALARALPIIKAMEPRAVSLKDLTD
jgi:hypothetical protein